MAGGVQVSEASDLIEALGLGEREHIALVGAGGKSSLLLGLGNALVEKGARVVITTTTRVGREEAERAPALIFVSEGEDWKEGLLRKIEDYGLVFVAGQYSGPTKIKGIGRERADELCQFSFLDYLIVEADGASRRPIKAPGPWEPVIPGCSTLVVGMAGAEALGARVDEETVFRLEAFCEVTGTHRGKTITPLTAAHVFLDKRGLFKDSPIGARHVAFLNKSDLLKDLGPAHEWAEIVLSSPGAIDRAIVGSIKTSVYKVFEKI